MQMHVASTLTNYIFSLSDQQKLLYDFIFNKQRCQTQDKQNPAFEKRVLEHVSISAISTVMCSFFVNLLFDNQQRVPAPGATNM